MRFVPLLLVLGLVTSAFADEAVDSEKPLLAFINDATSFEGMYYSVRDYCAPFAGPSIVDKSERLWTAENRQLLSDRDAAINELVVKLHLDSAAAEKIKDWNAGVRAQFHDSDRLYKDLTSAPDMHIACSKRLGEMVSDSMRFQRIAPTSYALWKRRSAP
jgi:hypothetical protein